MKASDLMIGDLVRTTSVYKVIKDIQVHALSAYSVQDETTSQWIECQHLEPISLTEEILEKNFVVEQRNKYIQWVPCKDCNTCFDIQIFINSTMIETFFEYVHELQHALRLCGIDKEIVL